jgi:hypothetical protein
MKVRAKLWSKPPPNTSHDGCSESTRIWHLHALQFAVEQLLDREAAAPVLHRHHDLLDVVLARQLDQRVAVAHFQQAGRIDAQLLGRDRDEAGDVVLVVAVVLGGQVAALLGQRAAAEEQDARLQEARLGGLEEDHARQKDTGGRDREHQQQDAASEVQVRRQVEHQGQDEEAQHERGHQLHEERVAQALVEIELVHAHRAHAEDDRGGERDRRGEEVVQVRRGRTRFAEPEKAHRGTDVGRAQQHHQFDEQQHEYYL